MTPERIAFACKLHVDVRVRTDELEEIRRDVMTSGRHYTDDNLDGAMIDCNYGLDDFGFTSPKITKTGDLKQMVLYESRPSWPAQQSDDVVARLEESWVKQGAFRNEAHAISVTRERVALDFVTWWDSGDYYTGRIEIALTDYLQLDE